MKLLKRLFLLATIIASLETIIACSTDSDSDDTVKNLVIAQSMQKKNSVNKNYNPSTNSTTNSTSTPLSENTKKIVRLSVDKNTVLSGGEVVYLVDYSTKLVDYIKQWGSDNFITFLHDTGYTNLVELTKVTCSSDDITVDKNDPCVITSQNATNKECILTLYGKNKAGKNARATAYARVNYNGCIYVRVSPFSFYSEEITVILSKQDKDDLDNGIITEKHSHITRFAYTDKKLYVDNTMEKRDCFSINDTTIKGKQSTYSTEYNKDDLIGLWINGYTVNGTLEAVSPFSVSVANDLMIRLVDYNEIEYNTDSSAPLTNKTFIGKTNKNATTNTNSTKGFETTKIANNAENFGKVIDSTRQEYSNTIKAEIKDGYLLLTPMSNKEIYPSKTDGQLLAEGKSPNDVYPTYYTLYVLNGNTEVAKITGQVKEDATLTYKIEEKYTYSGNWRYEINSSGITITGTSDSKKTQTTLSIPNTLEGKSVTKIGSNAFQNYKDITSITLPDTITEIGYMAFYNCSVIDNVELPKNLTKLGMYAFEGCKKLSTIIVPDGVTELSNTFEGCETLTSVTLPKKLEKIGSMTFYNCKALTSINIPDTVKEIGMYAFENCTKLQSANLPDSLTSVGIECFKNCTALQTLTIPSSLKSYSYLSLTGVKWETSSYSSYANNSFRGCSKLPNATQTRLIQLGYTDGFTTML